MWKPESLGQYRCIWASIVLSAPDNFPGLNSENLDQEKALREEFDRLRDGFRLARSKLKAPRMEGIARELIEMSFEAYLAGDAKTGAHTLQECEGLIWPGSRLKVKYGVDAERRAFGDNVVYAGVVVSPYPYEGTSSDVAAEQATLLAAAKTSCHNYLTARRDFKFFALVMDQSGQVKKVTSAPDDVLLSIAPVEKSFRGTFRRLKNLAESGEIRACLLTQVIGPLGSGLAIYDIEQPGKPRVSARQAFSTTLEYEPMRYHLEDREWF
jgi:hypothetical protein